MANTSAEHTATQADMELQKTRQKDVVLRETREERHHCYQRPSVRKRGQKSYRAKQSRKQRSHRHAEGLHTDIRG